MFFAPTYEIALSEDRAPALAAARQELAGLAVAGALPAAAAGAGGALDRACREAEAYVFF